MYLHMLGVASSDPERRLMGVRLVDTRCKSARLHLILVPGWAWEAPLRPVGGWRVYVPVFGDTMANRPGVCPFPIICFPPLQL
jgi:hypothetical protein